MFCIDEVKWVFRLEDDFSYKTHLQVPQKYIFRDKNGVVRLIIDRDGKFTVTKGYAWNGCSPKFMLFDLIIGTPDGVVHKKTGKRKTYYATCLHDALYQFIQEIAPLSRADADRIFLNAMKETKFIYAYIYWFFVRLFGWLVWRTWKHTRKLHGTREVVIEQGTEE
jgi:hypothetical protein